MHKTSTGTIEIIKTDHGSLIRIFNESTKHEVGITIPRTHIWSFLNRRFFGGSNESIEILVKNNRILIHITLNFDKEINILTTVSKSIWNQIESEIRSMA